MRKHYLDNIRWCTGVVVVLYHVIYMYNAQGIAGGLGPVTDQSVQYQDLFMYAVYPWLMPVLFIVSGISSRLYLEKHTDRGFIRTRTTRLLVPSTMGLFVFQFIQGYISMHLTSGWDMVADAPIVVKYLLMALSGIGVLWYMQILWLFTVMLTWIRKTEKDRGWNLGSRVNLIILLAMTPLIWLSAQSGNTPVIVVYRFGLYGTMFFLGYYVFSHDEVIEELKKYSLWLLSGAIVLGVVFCAVYFGKNICDAPINRSILFTSYCWLGSLAYLGGMARYCDYETDFTRWMSKHSFGLYVFHYLGISAVALLVGKQNLLPALWIYVLSLIAGFASGYILEAVISRIPFIRWAVLGIQKKG